MSGRLVGSLTSQNTCQRLASSELISSSRSRSTERKPCSDVEQHRKQSERRRHRDLRFDLVAEPDDVERRDRDLRQALQGGDIGKERRSTVRNSAMARPDQSRARRRSRSRRRRQQRIGEMIPEAGAPRRIVPQAVEQRAQDGDRRRQDIGRASRNQTSRASQTAKAEHQAGDQRGEAVAISRGVSCACVPPPQASTDAPSRLRMRATKTPNCGFVVRSNPRGRGNGIANSSMMRPGRAAHDQHPVGEEHRFENAVGDEEHRLAVGDPDALQLEVHALARQRVERAERLVHQQHARIVNEAPGDADALLHAAGQLGRIFASRSREPDQGEQVAGARLGRARGRGGECGSAR